MPEIPIPDASTPIIDENGVMTAIFQRWVTAITMLDLIVGSGSPEGVIDATVGRFYLNDTGTTITLLYVKKLAEIGGDSTMGWEAVG